VVAPSWPGGVVGCGGVWIERGGWLFYRVLVGEATGESRTLAMPELPTKTPKGVVSLLKASTELPLPTFLAPSRQNPRSGFSDRRWWRHGVVFPLRGFVFGGETTPRDLCPCRWTTMVCCSWSTLHMQGASEEPFGLAHGFDEAHLLLFRTCHSFSELQGW
jgi:hypothetical protein